MDLSDDLDICISVALSEAGRLGHSHATVEHLLQALILDEAAADVLRHAGADLGRLTAELERYLREELPGLSKRQIARIRRLAENGPPTEEVGLEPFAPPEVMPTKDGDLPLPMVGGRG